MPGWFDITSLGEVLAHQDEEGMLKSANVVHRLITEEVEAGIPSDRIIVGGFSQGIYLSSLS
jgi:lysophospholipase-1/lysophospholipase-2